MAGIKYGAGFEDKQKSCAIMHKLFHSHSLKLGTSLSLLFPTYDYSSVIQRVLMNAERIEKIGLNDS
jgi:hypothetical protein